MNSDPGVFPKALLLEKWVPPKDVFLPTKTSFGGTQYD